MFNNNIAIVSQYEEEEDGNTASSKEQHVINYVKSIDALEQAIEPFAEQKRDLRKEYLEEGYLTRDEIWAAVKAYRIYKKSGGMTELTDMYALLEKELGPSEA